jgi:hypothetical protein
LLPGWEAQNRRVPFCSNSDRLKVRSTIDECVALAGSVS